MKVKESGCFRHRSWCRTKTQRTTMFAMVGVLLLHACVYDSGRRCDPGQLFDGLAFVCGAAAVMKDDGQCVACGANEVAAGTKCQCAEGFARASSDAPCAGIPVYVPPACDAETSPCTDATVNYCQAVSGTSGYCTTSGCTSIDDCNNGFRCDTVASPTYCRRPPTGQGKSCKSASDCAGADATYCDSYQTHLCYVQGCSMSSDDCFPGYACCDLTSLGLASTLCLPEGSCPT
jgi:hypothetical protein